MDKISYIYKTEIGKFQIIEEYGDIICVNINTDKNIREQESKLIRTTYLQIKEYLQEKRKEFDIPIKMYGTEFQKKVWKELQKIPYGETRSYKQIAENIGNSKACRAVGMANHNNPIAIIIPCHRVIGTNDKLVGYAGGIDIKQKLLNLEKN